MVQNKPLQKSRGRRGEVHPAPALDTLTYPVGLSPLQIQVIALGFLVLATVAVYLPGLFQEVVDLDYSGWVRAVQPFGWKTLKEVFSYDGARWKELGYFAPLTATSFMVDLYGGTVTGHQDVVHKTVNLLLHLVNTCLVVWLLRLLGFREWVRFAVAAIFALHPLQVTSLEWIAERKNLLMTGFFLGGLVFYSVYRGMIGRAGQFLYYLGALGCFVAALLCKPAAVVFGPCLILTDVLLMDRRITSRTFLRSAPFLILGVVWSVVAMKTELGITQSPPLTERLLLAPYQMAFLAAKFFLPTGLTLLYPYPNLDVSFLAWWVPALGLFAGLGAAVRWLYASGYRGVVWGGAFYVLNLAPSSGIVPFSGMRELWTADHYQYLAIIGLGLAVALAVEAVTGLLNGRKRIAVRGIAFAAAVIAMCLLSHQQVKIWSGPESLWTHVIRLNPGSAMGHLNYGSHLYEKGRYLDAEREFREALSLNEPYAESYKIACTLGLLSEHRGAQDQAVLDLRKALQLNPRHGESHLVLSRLMFGRGAFAQALEHCKKAEQFGTPCNHHDLRKLIAAESVRMMREYVRQ